MNTTLSAQDVGRCFCLVPKDRLHACHWTGSQHGQRTSVRRCSFLLDVVGICSMLGKEHLGSASYAQESFNTFLVLRARIASRFNSQHANSFAFPNLGLTSAMASERPGMWCLPHLRPSCTHPSRRRPSMPATCFLV